jgi:hypothetical protein
VEGSLDANKITPRVFIIESLTLKDEANKRFEGRILKQILRLSGKESAYYYIRTRRELERIARLFGRSGFRYLHISCHGNSNEMATTFGSISFPELGHILRPHLRDRRVFLSACEMTTRSLARELISGSGCYSVIGPSDAVRFGDAAILWSSFYHLMFRTNESAMQRKWILAHLRKTTKLFRVRMNYFARSRKQGIRSIVLGPGLKAND